MMWLIGGTCLFVGAIIGFFTAALLAANGRDHMTIDNMK